MHLSLMIVLAFSADESETNTTNAQYLLLYCLLRLIHTIRPNPGKKQTRHMIIWRLTSELLQWLPALVRGCRARCRIAKRNSLNSYSEGVKFCNKEFKHLTFFVHILILSLLPIVATVFGHKTEHKVLKGKIPLVKLLCIIKLYDKTKTITAKI